MGEGEPQTTQRLNVRQAAARLGISEGAVRSRIKRGTLRTDKVGDRVYVVLGADEPSDEPSGQSPLVGRLEDEVAHLRQQLEQANERDRENRRIIAALTQRIPAIEAPASGATEPPEAPERGTDEQQGRGPIPEDASPQTPSERPWWQRWFGSVDR